MTGLQTLRIAGKALMRNKLRSFLTALGIIIGVAAVIAMVAIGDGAKAMVEKSFASMGSNLLVVMSGTTTAGGAHGGFGSLTTITWDDLAAIQREVPSVQLMPLCSPIESGDTWSSLPSRAAGSWVRNIRVEKRARLDTAVTTLAIPRT